MSRSRKQTDSQQTFVGICNGGGNHCGRELRFRFRTIDGAEQWELLAYDLEAGHPVVIEDRTCPGCGHSFRGLSADTLKNLFSPGATLSEAENSRFLEA